MPLKKPRVVFFTPYPHGTAPGPRFRFEQYLDALTGAGFDWLELSFLTTKGYKSIYKKGNSLQKVSIVLSGFVKRFLHLVRVLQADYVFIYREVTPIGPPVYEWIIAKVLQKKVIFDFDDAIWLTDLTSESQIQKWLRWRSKVSLICRWSYKVSCGNAYLSNFASQYNKTVVLNPTTIETRNISAAQIEKDTDNIIIGWTGSHSTLKYLSLVEGVLERVESSYPKVSFTVIADKPPELKLKRLHFVPWSRDTEIEDLRNFSIGIMPLPDDEWTRGKCGFKALQYMALGIPTIASPVGVNQNIIEHSKNGFLCKTDEDWLLALVKLINEVDLRKKLGAAGRETVESFYSTESNTQNFLSLFS